MSSDFQIIHGHLNVFQGNFSSQSEVNHHLNNDFNVDLDGQLPPSHVLEVNQLIEEKVDQVDSDYNVN